MNEFLQTLLISCIPAIITGVVSYLVARKNASTQIKLLETQNKHDIDRLMEQHKIDIDSLNQQHQLELEKLELEHKHKLELAKIESENALNQNLINNVVGEAMKMPEIQAELAKGIRSASNKRGGKR